MRRDLLEDEGNTERWMISYADFITLLFAFFVVMYAISSVNNEKYRVLSHTLAEAFQVHASSMDPIQIGEPTRSPSPHVVDVPDSEGWADQDPGNTEITGQDEMAAELAGFTAAEGVSMDINNDWVEFNLSAELLFPQGGAELSAAAAAQLTEVLEVVQNNQNPITIEGFTDNVAPQGGAYPSNWELSGARAASVARYLIQSGVRRQRIAAVGYGENHPLATNATPEGRAQNRRVSIILARRSDLARNRNADAQAIAIQNRTPVQGSYVTERTEQGGLLFTNEEGETQ